MADFEEAVNYVLGNEGAYINNPSDPGGPTKYGITLDMLSKWRKKDCHPIDVQNMTLTEAKTIYESQFWDPLRISSLSQPIATAILDTAVNEGQYSAIKLAQMALGSNISPDGVMGLNTLQALDSINPRLFLIAFMGEIQSRYVRLVVNTPSQIQFLEGWLSRSRKLMSLA